ncbi:MAG: helix-turn-helix transcriptional regulator [Bulleidia sp.]|nr:helix-turn-helix transcriptional regulator [Bulleidia sp.]
MKNRIKSLRIEKGLSQAELSEQIGCTQQALSKIEKGNRVPGVDLAIKIANYFNVTVEFLYYETNFSGSIKTDQEFNEFTEHLQRLMKYLKL